MIKKLNIKWFAVAICAGLGAVVGVLNPLICDGRSFFKNTFLATILTDFTAFTIIGCVIIWYCTKRFNIASATAATFAFFLAYTPVYYIAESIASEYKMDANREVFWLVIMVLTLPGAWIVAHFTQRTKLGLVAVILPNLMMGLMLFDYTWQAFANNPYVSICTAEDGCKMHEADIFILSQRIVAALIALAFLVWWNWQANTRK